MGIFIEESREQIAEKIFIYNGTFIAIKDVEEYQTKLQVEYIDEKWEITDIVIKVEKKNEYQSIYPLYSIVIMDQIMECISLPIL